MSKEYSSYFEGVHAYLNNQSKLLHRILRSGKLTNDEITILRVRKLFSVKKYNAAFCLLIKNGDYKDIFLNAERNYLLSNCKSYLSDWESAILYSENALKVYQEINHDRGIFLAGYNLSAFYNRLGLHRISIKFIEVIKLSATEESQKSLIYRALACYNLALNKVDEAKSQMDLAIEGLSKMNTLDQVTTLSVAIDIYFRLGELEESRKILSSISKSKSLRENVKLEFDRVCLNEYLETTSSIISLQPSESLQNSEEYSTKLKILKLLKSGEHEQAGKIWVQLSQSLPQRYLPDFKCAVESENKSLFMSLVNKWNQRNSFPSTEKILERLYGKTKILYKELIKPGLFKRKENLIESIWKTKYDASYDSRFYKLIQRFKDSTGIQLEKKNHCYSLPQNF